MVRNDPGYVVHLRRTQLIQAVHRCGVASAIVHSTLRAEIDTSHAGEIRCRADPGIEASLINRGPALLLRESLIRIGTFWAS